MHQFLLVLLIAYYILSIFIISFNVIKDVVCKKKIVERNFNLINLCNHLIKLCNILFLCNIKATHFLKFA